jgi:cyclohexa-1,5-dienecarbonyl-CoA hydratase
VSSEADGGCRQGPEGARDVRAPVRPAFRLNVGRRIATLTFDRPPLNVLDIKTLREMTAALKRVVEREDVGVLVLAGAGKAFSAGVDVGEHRPETVHAMIHAFHDFCRAILEFPRPTMARVHGPALGGGCEVVLCCDLAVAAASARLGQPEIALGVFPPLAAVLLPRLAGRAAAARTVLWGEVVPAETALSLGLVGEVVPDDRLEARVLELAGRAAGLSSKALALARQALRRGAEGPLEEALGTVEKIYLDDLMKTEDAAEGLSAFLEKRPPSWRHR